MLEPLELRRLLSGVAPQTFYVSPTGSDASNGLTPSTAWQDLAPVNAHSFVAGDRILLQGGATFLGPLGIGIDDTGTAALPITVSSFGTGRATVAAPTGAVDGIDIINTGGVSISNLVVTAAAGNTANGINIANDLPGDVKLSGITVSDVDVSGFGNAGVGIIGTIAGSGFDGISVLDSALHDNSFAGLFAYASTETANPANAVYDVTNLLVDHVVAFDNPGVPGPTDAGDGILVSNVDTATIQYCTAYGNGTANDSTIGGAGAIWCYDSHAVVIQYCEAYDNYGLHTDGGGFDLDGGCNSCIIQYDYSHDNTGAGLLLDQIDNGAPSTGNIIRYNISQNDGRMNDYPSIDVYDPGTYAEVTNAYIYGNDIYVTPVSGGSTAGAMRIFGPTTNLHVFNNVFDVTANVATLDVLNTGSGLVIAGNDYWTGSASNIDLTWAGTSYTTLSAFRSATGQEKVGSTAVGESVDPQFVSPGNGGTVPVDELESMTAYRLASTSPLIDAGVSVASFSIAAAAADFFGDALPQGAGYDVGAYQSGAVAPLVLSADASGPSSIYLQPQADGVTLDVWIDSATPGTGTPTQTVSIASLSGIDILAGTGPDSVTFDFTLAGSLAGLPIRVAGDAARSAQVASLTIIGPATGSTVSLGTTALTAGYTTIDYDSLGAILIDGGAGNDTLTQAAQPMAPVTFNGGGGSDTLAVNAGTYTFAGDPQAATSNLTVQDNAAVIFAAGADGAGIATRELAALSLGSGALASVADPDLPADRAVLVLGQLSLAAGATLDLGANDLLLRNQAAALSTVTADLASGFNAAGGYWNGTGITSSDAAANPAATTALAAIPNLLAGAALTGSFDGVATTTADVLVKYTYYGDANFDGVVDASDTALIQNAVKAGVTGWLAGDVNDDGTIDATDATLIARGLADQGASLGRSINLIGTTPTDPTPPITPVSTSSLTATIVRSTLAASVVAGSAARGTVIVTIANPTAAAVHGSMTVRVYGVAGGTADDTAVLLASLPPRTLTLKAGHSLPLSVPVRSIPANLIGTYALTAQLTDPSQNTAISPAGPSITSAAPYIAFSDTLISTTLAPADVSGQKTAAAARLKITNTGNIASTRASTIAFYASTDGTVANGTPIRSVKATVALKPGASRVFTVPLLKLPAVSNGAYSIVAQVTDQNQDVTTAVGSQTYQLAQPFVSLVPSAGAVTPIAGGAAMVSFTLSNNGNVTSGASTMTLYSSADGAVAGVAELSQTLPLPIAAAKARAEHVRLTAPEFAALKADAFAIVQVTDASGTSESLTLSV